MYAEPHGASIVQHEMTGGKNVRGLQVRMWTAEIKLCLLQRPAVWCLAVEGPCAGSRRFCLLLIHSGSAGVWRYECVNRDGRPEGLPGFNKLKQRSMVWV